MRNSGTINVISLITAIFLVMAFHIQDTHAGDVKSRGSRPISISEMKKHITAPRIYSVQAYVIHKDDKCPPCPPNAVCETCVLGIYVSDNNHPRKPSIPMANWIYLRTNKPQEFIVGNMYIFKIRYRTELNSAGAWLQTGPELVDYRDLERE